ncbi:MAG: sodium:calcium antiporter [Actinomycetota bacterium]
MTAPVADHGRKVDESGWLLIALAAASTVPGLLVKFEFVSTTVEVETVLFGVAILGSAFLLSWGAEVAQLDISQALAIAFLAFIAVLPEYAVDLTFAWKAGAQDAIGVCHTVSNADPCTRDLAIANMTGANRLLIGLGWAAVVLIWGWRSGAKGVTLPVGRRTELGFLLLATLWAFSIPIRGNLSLIDLGVLGAMFVAYVWRAAKQESEHPDLIGPPVVIAALPQRRRRIVTIGMFVFSAAVILVCAEPFADGLVHTGRKLGISPFLLVQWLAPLASEAPEMIVAILFVLRAKPDAGLGTLVSSKVNQWTLLIATIPLVYTVSRGGIHPMALGERQVEEVFLTAAQSAFAIGVLANLTIARWEAIMLLVLFGTQFGFESTTVRYGFSFGYIGLLLLILVRERSARQGLRAALADALTPPWRK